MKRFGYFLTKNSKKLEVKVELSPLQLSNLKRCLLSIYEDVFRVCDKYGLCLMLTGGSALGAVRHKGFIPWDDDMDLLMPRKDYDKLIEVLPKELGDKYYFSAPQMDQPAHSLFLKIYRKDTLVSVWPFFKKEGVHLDIFPLEYTPNSLFLTFLKSCVSFTLRTIAICSKKDELRNKNFEKAMSVNLSSFFYYKICCLIGLVFSFKNQKYWFDLYDKFVSMSKKTKYMAIPTGKHHYKGELFPVDFYLPPMKGEFEGRSVFLPNKCGYLLTNLYGNYMQIPPVDKRECHFYIEFNLGSDSENNRKDEYGNKNAKENNMA